MHNQLKTFRGWNQITSRHIDEAIREVGQDWSVSKRPVHFQAQDGSFKEYSDRFVVVRDDTETPLSVASRNYKPLQNDEAFRVFHRFVEDGTIRLEWGGYLGEGVSTFLIGTLDGHGQIEGQEFDLKVALSNDYSGRRSVRLTVIPIVDDIYVPVSLVSMQKSWAIWHTSSLTKNLQKAEEAIRHAYEYAQEFCQYAQDLCNQEVTRIDARTFFNELMPPSQNEGTRGRTIREGNVHRMLDAYDKLVGNKNSKWGLLMAVASAELYKTDIRPGETPTSQTFLSRKETMMRKMLNGNMPVFNKAEKLLQHMEF